jgi:type IV pilus assembly protein PilA
MKPCNEYTDEKGFTLIELLIVIAIIGVLASIAIPTFATYRNRAYDSAVMSDLRNAATAQEAYYIDNNIYSSNVTNLETEPYNFFLSENVSVTITHADFVGYEMTAVHSNSGKVYTLSGPGGQISD